MRSHRKKHLAVVVVLALLMTALPTAMADVAFGAVVPQYTYLHYVSGGVKADNTSENNYTRASQPVCSYLAEEHDGTYTNVQIANGTLHIETYSSAFQRLSTKKIELELPLFGGYFRGEQYNFVVCGQNNSAEDNNAEVVRVIKYDRQWNRLGAVSISNINTVIPFRSGCLRMAETDDTLLIHTSHQMYTSEDGLNHQANMTFAIEKASMTLTQSFTKVWNISSGYVSHSFNQFVLTDGDTMYRLDHGDAYPRAVVLTKAPASSIATCNNIHILDIAGEVGDNYTGVSVGGFVQAGDRLIAAGNSVDQTTAHVDTAGTRNVFVNITDTGLAQTHTVWLTKYGADADITVRTPQLVKTDTNQLYVLWEECNQATGKTVVRVARIDTNGNVLAGPYKLQARLSDCQPICTADGHILWEVSKTGSTTFYDVNPDKLAEYEQETLSALPKKNAVVKVSGVTYKVTKSSRTAGTVTYVTPKSKTSKSLVIPATVKIKGVSYKVTAVGTKACYGMQRLTNVTVGSNVTSLGSKAFQNCRNLRTITIKSTKLNKVGSAAIKGISKTAVIRCPSNCLETYKKKFSTKTGFKASMRIKEQ